MKEKRKKQLLGFTIILSVILFSSLIGFQFGLSSVPVAGPYYLDIPFGDATYYIGKYDSGDTYMIDVDTWRCVWTSSNSSAIFEACFSNLTGAAPKQRIVARGDFDIDVPLAIPDYCILDLYEADITLADNSDCNMIETRDSTDGNIMVEIWGGWLDGNTDNNAFGDGIHWNCSGGSKGDVYNRYSLIVKDTYLVNVTDNGIFYDTTDTGSGKYNVKLSKVTVIHANCAVNMTNPYDSFIGEESFLLSRASGDRDIYLFAPTAMHIEGIYCPYQGLEIAGGNANIFSNIICDGSPTEGIIITGALKYSVFADIRVSGCGTSANNTYAGIDIGGTANHNVFSTTIVDQQGKTNMYTYCIEEGAGCDFNEFGLLILEEYVTGGLRVQGGDSEADAGTIIGTVV